MTAEVAILNTQGVAIAADSAVTINVDGVSKTYYTAQKIFNLSQKHSVGIMIHGSTMFMQVEWEILINEFSKDLGDRVLPSLKEYAEYFIEFLRDFPHINDTKQKVYLEIMSYRFFREVKERYDSDISENHKDKKLTKAQQNELLTDVLKKVKEELVDDTFSSTFVDDGFVNDNKAIITKELDEIFADFPINAKTKEEMINLFLLDIEKAEIGSWWSYQSGIVFSGYGDKEIFPSVIEFSLLGRLGKNILRNNIKVTDVISDSTACISPFAQPNVINTFIRGIAPDFKDMIFNELEALVSGTLNIVGKKHTEELNKLKDELKSKIEDFQHQHFSQPILSIVDSLPKSNLADMAEALINLTALRQQVSTEAQTVGGPTDVALITKMDGFVWIKKKQLFQSVQYNRA